MIRRIQVTRSNGRFGLSDIEEDRSNRLIVVKKEKTTFPLPFKKSQNDPTVKTPGSQNDPIVKTPGALEVAFLLPSCKYLCDFRFCLLHAFTNLMLVSGFCLSLPVWSRSKDSG